MPLHPSLSINQSASNTNSIGQLKGQAGVSLTVPCLFLYNKDGAFFTSADIEAYKVAQKKISSLNSSSKVFICYQDWSGRKRTGLHIFTANYNGSFPSTIRVNRIIVNLMNTTHTHNTTELWSLFVGGSYPAMVI